MKSSIRRRTALVVSSALLCVAVAGFTAGSAQAVPAAAAPSWTDATPSGEVTSLTFRFNIRGSDYPYFKDGYPSSYAGIDAAAGAAGNWCGPSVCFQLGSPAVDAGWSITSVSKVNQSGSQFDLDVVVSAAAGAGTKDSWVNLFASPSVAYKLVGGGFPIATYYNQAIWSGYVWADTPAPDAPWIGYCGPSSCANLPAVSSDRNQKINMTTVATGTTFECSLDDAPFVSCSGPIGSPHIVGPLADGPHSFAAKAKKGSYVSSVTKVNWTVAGGTVSAPAKPTFSGRPTSSTTQTSASISFESAGATSYTCSVDGGGYSACTSPKALTGLRVGSHSIAVKARNEGGESEATTYSWVIVSSGGTPGPAVSKTTPTVTKSFPYWMVKLDKTFSVAPGRAALQTVQFSTKVAKPAAKPVPTSPKSAPLIFSWAKSIKVAGKVPTWVRVGDKAGRWTDWVVVKP